MYSHNVLHALRTQHNGRVTTYVAVVLFAVVQCGFSFWACSFGIRKVVMHGNQTHALLSNTTIVSLARCPLRAACMLLAIVCMCACVLAYSCINITTVSDMKVAYCLLDW